MKLYLVIGVVISAAVCIVYSTHCDHNDPATCQINCTNPNEVAGCEHNICTCVSAGASGQACQQKQDCHGHDFHPHCPDPEIHCMNNVCKCRHH